MSDSWRRCSSCKVEIGHGQMYWVCNVSTCNRARTGLVFCTVECWDAHLGSVNHRESWAVEKQAPTASEAAAAQSAKPRSSEPAKRDSSTPTPVARPAPVAPATEIPRDVLVVASKLKSYIKARSGTVSAIPGT